MKRILFLWMILLCLPVRAEETVLVRYKDRLTVPADTVYLDMDTVKVSDWPAFSDFLSALPRLEKVDMFATRVGQKHISELTKQFPQITFGWTIVIGDGHTVRTDQTAFSTLHSSRDDPHTSRDLSLLRFCRELRALDIGHNEVDDLTFLSGLTELRVLILGRNRISDLSPLANLTQLEYLELFSNDVRDLSALKNMPRLTDLNLCFNRIGDLSPLCSLGALQRVWIYNCNNYSDASPVPREQVEMLRSALPGAVIDDVSYVTEGGWREGSHWETVHSIFRTGVYLPFPDSNNTASEETK